MRHRLIPVEERLAMHREYYVRVAIVSVFALAITVALGAAALFPADIRARVADQAALQAVATAKNSSDKAALDAAEKQLTQANTLLAALGTSTTQVRFSQTIRSIVAAHGPVLISSFGITRDGTKSVSVTLQGIAPTRNNLLALKGRLEALSPGATVELPISTLAKSTNVSFTLRLTQPLIQ